MYRTILTALFVSTLATSASAAVVYTEDFSGQEDKGAIGGTIDTSGVGWSIDLGDAQLFNNSDSFAVDNGVFTARDTNAGCLSSMCNSSERGDPISGVTLPMWLSPIIDISGLTDLSLTFDFYADGTFEDTGGVGAEDTSRVEVLIDGSSVANLSLDFGSQNIFDNETIAGGLGSLGTGSSLQIKWSGNAYAGSEYLGIDNVTLSALPAAVPLPAAGWLMLAGLGGLAAARRKRRA